MDKKWLKIVLAALNVVSTFSETNEFIDSTLKEECEREKITADEVIFFLLNLQKKLAWIIKKAKSLSKAIITFDDHRWSCRI